MISSNQTLNVFKKKQLNKTPFYFKAVAYIQSLATQYPDKIEIQNIGTTYEGRTLYNVKVSSSPNKTCFFPKISHHIS